MCVSAVADVDVLDATDAAACVVAAVAAEQPRGACVVAGEEPRGNGERVCGFGSSSLM